MNKETAIQNIRNYKENEYWNGTAYHHNKALDILERAKAGKLSNKQLAYWANRKTVVDYSNTFSA